MCPTSLVIGRDADLRAGHRVIGTSLLVIDAHDRVTVSIGERTASCESID
ncbi:hypothetical protein [Microbacterium gubbeenense]